MTAASNPSHIVDEASHLDGTDTTIHAMANAPPIIFADVSIQAAIAKDGPGMMQGLVEKTMRLYRSVRYQYRMTLAVDMPASLRIPKGQKLVLFHSVTNRDPRQCAVRTRFISGASLWLTIWPFKARALALVLSSHAARPRNLQDCRVAVPATGRGRQRQRAAEPCIFLRLFRPQHARWSAKTFRRMSDDPKISAFTAVECGRRM